MKPRAAKPPCFCSFPSRQLIHDRAYRQRASSYNRTDTFSQLVTGVLLFSFWAAFALYPLVVEGQPSETPLDVEYQAQGNIAYTGFRSDGSVLSQFERRFRVWVKGDRWRVRTVAANDSNSLEDYRELSKEGPDIYSLLVFSTNAIQTPAFTTNKQTGRIAGRQVKDSNIAAGIVRSSLVPAADSGSLASYVWLALASESYFRAVSGSNTPLRVIWPVLSGRTIDTEASLPAEWTSLAHSWYLPAHVTYFSSGSAASDGTRDLNGPATNAVYEVLDHTNVGGVTLPLNFRLLLYGKTPNPRTGAGSVVVRITGSVTGVSSGASDVSFIPALSGKTTVDDRRTGQNVKYIAQNKRWLRKDEVEKRAAAGLLSPVDSPRKTVRTKRLIFFFALMCFLVGPLVLAYIHRKNDTKQQRQVYET